LLLFEAVSTQWRLYFGEQHKLNRDLDGNFRDMNKSEKSRAAELTKRMNEIDLLREGSIVQCPVCRKIDKDMTFNPVLKEWYCVQCSQEMVELYHLWQRKEGRAKKLIFDDFNEEFYKTFLD